MLKFAGKPQPPPPPPPRREQVECSQCRGAHFMPYRDSMGNPTACVTLAWVTAGLELADSGYTVTCVQCGLVQTVTHAGRVLPTQRQGSQHEQAAAAAAARPLPARAIDELVTDLMP